jgi:hypothetical protein
MKPQNNDAVLGGNASPLTTAAVLGGQGKYLAKLFDCFNSEAKLCNEQYYRLELNHEVALVRKIRRDPLADLKVKVLQVNHLVLEPEGRPYTSTFWLFAGYLKHDGALFIPATATYDPAGCEKQLRAKAYQALITKGQG